MKIYSSKITALLVCALLLSACSEKTPEPVDEEGTEQLNQKLLESMREISAGETEKVESAGQDELEKLSEADRQSLIDLTIEESSKAIQEDADKVVELLEDINGISEE